MPVLFALVLVLLVSCQKTPERPAEMSGLAMGATYSIKVYRSSFKEPLADLHNAIKRTISDADKAVSIYVEDSEITNFNRVVGTDWFAISPQLTGVIAEALDLSVVSNGAFDVTIGNLIETWGFGKTIKPDKVPTLQEIRLAQQTSGFKNLEISPDRAFLRKTIPALTVNLSAVAQGYGVDVVAAYLESKGIDRFLVEIGGEVRTKGLKSDGTPWKVAIERPEADTRSIYKIIKLTNLSLATSGDYRNYYEIAGRRYSHIIDPATGRPIDNAIASVSVLHPSCMIADALATTLMVMGYEEGARFAEARHYAVLWILRTEEGLSERMSAAFDSTLIH